MNGLTEQNLAEIEGHAAAATPGPWFVRYLDDDYAANLVAIGTVCDPDPTNGPRWPALCMSG